MNTVPTKLKTGDEVVVVTGKDKGKKGTLRKILKAKNKGFVTGINMVKKHTKPNPEMGVEVPKKKTININLKKPRRLRHSY